MVGDAPKLCSTAFVVLVLSALPARAQPVAGDTARLESVRTLLRSIPLESRIRITTVGQAIIEGRLAAHSDTGVVVRHRSDSVRASIARIAVIWRPAPNYKSGLIAGGLAGAVVGSLALGTLAQGLCEANCEGAFAYGATVGAGLGAAAGAVVGLAVGALTHHWKQVWP